jgi:hypothetical protein
VAEIPSAKNKEVIERSDVERPPAILVVLFGVQKTQYPVAAPYQKYPAKGDVLQSTAVVVYLELTDLVECFPGVVEAKQRVTGVYVDLGHAGDYELLENTL